jgi:hypothetical protein
MQIDTSLYIVPPVLYNNASQPPVRGPVVGPGINYTGPREALLEFVICQFKYNFMFVNMSHRIHKCTNTLYDHAIINY